VDDPYGKIREYIDHRLMREKEVLKCLGEGEQTIPTITDRIYTDTPRALHSMAQLSVEAHLLKLIKERRVRREGGRYFLAAGI
jgi:hypothetical protein